MFAKVRSGELRSDQLRKAKVRGRLWLVLARSWAGPGSDLDWFWDVLGMVWGGFDEVLARC